MIEDPTDSGLRRWLARHWRAPHANDPRTRILHVISSFQVGGMEHFAVRMAAAQQARGALAGVLALRAGPLHDEARRLGLATREVGGRTRWGRIGAALSFAVRFAPDVVHAHNTTSLHYGALCSQAVGCPLVMTFHGQGRGFARRPTSLEWRVLKVAAAVSQAAAEALLALAPAGKVVVLPNGIDMPPARGLRDRLREELVLGSTPTLIAVARMDGMKGHSDLLRALALLRRDGLDAICLLVGDGEERPALETLARELGLDGRVVRFLGFRHDVADLLEAADVFVLPSLAEGLPLALLEAMARGAAVVATRVGGVPEVVVDEQQALLVPPRAPAALARALARAVSDPDLRRALGGAARQRVEQEFTFGGMLDRYEGLYQQAGARAGTATRNHPATTRLSG